MDDGASALAKVEMVTDETVPLKRSQILAIENAKRIAQQLRAERNDAVALAQIRREQAERAVALCRRALAGEDRQSLLSEIEALAAELNADT